MTQAFVQLRLELLPATVRKTNCLDVGRYAQEPCARVEEKERAERRHSRRSRSRATSRAASTRAPTRPPSGAPEEDTASVAS